MTIPTEELLAHRAFVDRLARDLAADPEGASDLSQETWVRMLERGPAHAAALRAWLGRVAPRLAQRGAERDASRRDRERAAARPEAEVELAAARADRGAVLDAVQGLREPYRSAVLLRYYEDLPPAAIAERLGQPVDTVKTRLKRALRTLRADLGRSAADGRLLGFAPNPCFPDPPRIGGAATPLGGLLVGTKVVVGAVVGAVVLAGLILFLRTGDGEARAGAEPVAERPQPRPEERAGAPAELVASAPGALERAPAEAEQPAAEPERRSTPPGSAEGPAPEAAPDTLPATTGALVVHGHVFHQQGPPAPGATVVLGIGRTQTDENGAFALTLGRGMSHLDDSLALVAVLEGFAPAVVLGFGEVAEERARSGEGVELVLPGAAGAIAGFLLDQNGAPAAGWRIKVLDGSVFARTLLFPVSAESLAAEPEAVDDLGADAIGPASPLAGLQEIGDEGRFRFGGLSMERTYRLRAWNAGTLESVVSEPLAPGTEGYVLQVPGTPPRTLVDGVVVGTDGAPLDGVRCRLSMVEHEAGGTQWMTTGQELRTGADGRFAFHDVPHGELFARFDLEEDSANLTLEAGSEYRDVRVVLERAGGFSFESVDPGNAPDHVAVEDGRGVRLRIAYTLEPGHTAGTVELPVTAGVSPVGRVHESARFLVLLKDGAEVDRTELLVRPGEVTLVRR